MIAKAEARAVRASLGALLALAAATARADELGATPVPAEPRLRTIDYHADSVIGLTAFVGYHIHLEFAPDERFVTLAAGDTAAIDVGAEGNHLMLKPKQATVGTNLTLITNRRAYFIDYRALARTPRADEAIYSVTFRYPGESATNSVAPDTRSLAADVKALPAPVNTDYWYCGDPALRPSAADDDGIQVRLRFAARTELPAIYAAAADGSESLVNSHVEDDTVVVHRVAERLVLRRGRLVGCVLNRATPIAARRAASGTLRDSVERRTREVER